MDPSQGQMAYADPNAYAAYYGYQAYGLYPGGYAAAAAAAGYQPGGMGGMQQGPPPMAPPPHQPGLPDYLQGAHPEMMRGQPTRTLWLGNVPPQTSEEDLRGVFAPFAGLESIRMLHHKSCAFVSFNEIKDAAEAFRHNVGLTLHGTPIRVGWGKPEENKPDTADITGANNPPCRNLWVGNLTAGMTEEQLRGVFAPYGSIEAIKVLSAKNCAFVHFHSLEDAQAARQALNGRALADRTMRINYGKESNAPRATATSLAQGGAPPPPWEGGPAAGAPGGPMGGMPPSAAPGTPPPGFALPPANGDLVKIIDKMVGFIVRNGPLFEESVRSREANNPKFRFLFGGEGADYYTWKVYAARHGLPDNAPPPPGFAPHAAQGGPPLAAAAPPPPQQQQQGQSDFGGQHSAPPPPSNPSSRFSNAPPPQHNYPPPPPSSSASSSSAPSSSSSSSAYHQVPPPQQQHSHYPPQSSHAAPPSQPAYPYSAPPPPAPAAAPPQPQANDAPLTRAEEDELEDLIAKLSGTKESIKSGKEWILGHSDKSRAVVRLLVRRMAALADDATRRLYLVYLINDVLHHAVKKTGETAPDTFQRALAEGSNLTRLCQSAYAHQPTRTQEQLVKVLNLWADRGIYEAPFINDLIADMKITATSGKRSRDDERDDSRDRGRGGRWG